MPVRQALTRVIAAIILLLAAPAQAGVSCTLQVSAMSFGKVDVFGVLPLDRTLGNIEVTCSNAGASDTVVLLRTSVSPGGSGDENQRRMTGPGGSVLVYNLFRDISRTQLWRVGGDPMSSLSVPANNQTKLSLPVYGRLYGPRAAQSGEYMDTLITTLEF